MDAILLNCFNVHTIKSMYWGKISKGYNVFSNNKIRHLTIKNIGDNLVEGTGVG